LRSHFQTKDRDRDVFIPRPEFQSGQGVILLALDRHKSVSLTSDELHLTREAFREVAGKDGVVDVGELFQSGTGSFDTIDANDDKQLSYDEFSEFILQTSAA